MTQTPILQFGTSRFLQAHVDLFVSESLQPAVGAGPIAVVQTSSSAIRASRVSAFNAGRYDVRLRGLVDGRTVDETIEVRSVSRGLRAETHWAEIERIAVEQAHVIVSNTGDRGFELDPAERADDIVPRSFPAKLARLLRSRHRAGGTGLDIFPCELISNNGDTLRTAVLSVVRQWPFEAGLIDWLQTECHWVNSLVDRIVSAPIDPVGAVAEPYALWAIEVGPGLQPPCRHAAIVMTARLVDFERLKLFILNLGHTALVELWRQGRYSATLTVAQAMDDQAIRTALQTLFDEEVLPVFDAIGQSAAARAYRDTTIERFANPFLEHRLSDIANNHAAKRQRRLRPLVDLAAKHAPALTQKRLRYWLEGLDPC